MITLFSFFFPTFLWASATPWRVVVHIVVFKLTKKCSGIQQNQILVMWKDAQKEIQMQETGIGGSEAVALVVHRCVLI